MIPFFILSLVVVGAAFAHPAIDSLPEARAAVVRPGVLPPIPDSIPSQLGWVRVHRVPNLKCGGVDAYGCFFGPTRTLEVRAGLDRAEAWQTLEHERIHMILLDGHAQLPEDVEDQVADVIGAARVTQMLAELAAGH